MKVVWRHRIGKGLRHPRQALEFVLLGQQKFKFLHDQFFKETYLIYKAAELPTDNLETCFRWKPTDTLEEHMTLATDIHEHLATLGMLVVEHGFRRVLELGTRTGESTIALLLAAKRNGGHVTSIDMGPCLDARKAVEGLNLSPHWTFIQENDLQVQWSEPIDLLFVDTSHTYEQTSKELEKFEPYVIEGGVIVMHDIVSSSGVLDAIMLYVKGHNDLRVYRYLNNNGLGIIFKGKPRTASTEKP